MFNLVTILLPVFKYLTVYLTVSFMLPQRPSCVSKSTVMLEHN